MKRGAQGARIVIERVRSVELHSGRAFCKSNYARVITAQWSARVNVSIKRKRKKTRGGGSVKGGKGERRKKAKGYGEGNREKEALKSRVFDTYAQLRIGFKRKLGRYKSSVPSSITNIDLNHKDRPRYSIVGARLIVQFLLSSFRCQPLPLCLFLSFHFFSLPSSFSSLFSFSFFVSLFSSFLFFFFFFSFLLFRPATTYQSTYSARFMCHLWRSRATKMEIAVKENYVEVGFNHRRELNDRHSDGTLRARNAIVPRSTWSTFWRDNFREICGDARHPASIAVHRWLSFDEMRLSAIVLCPRAKWEFRYAPLYTLVFTAGDRAPPRRWRGYRRIIVRHNETRKKKFDC